ncbi:MAG: single-stranded DNA-binding protein [Erysipelotrichaceae bacterium]|nr:single-stranded DNA-binding protein [Erysipelotrichaceae bacterium]
MINRVVLVGRITRDPELRRTSTGTPVVSFTLAVDNRFAPRDSERTADFISCIAWSNAAEVMEKYVKKGALLGVDGRLQTRTYDGKDGKRVYITEVVCESLRMLDTRSASRGDDFISNIESYEPTNNKIENINKNDVNESDLGFDISDEDLPF